MFNNLNWESDTVLNAIMEDEDGIMQTILNGPRDASRVEDEIIEFVDECMDHDIQEVTPIGREFILDSYALVNVGDIARFIVDCKDYMGLWEEDDDE